MDKHRKIKNIIFNIYITGHNVEYLNHIYLASGSKPNEDFIFAVPESFDNVAKFRDWPIFSNVTIYKISKEEVDKCGGGLLKSAYFCSKLLSVVIKKFSADKVFLINLIRFLPFLPLFINKKVKVSGIIYAIYLYRWRDFSIFQKALDVIKYLIFTKAKIFEEVFILNDSASARVLNKKYKCEKFKYLPDPFVPIKVKSDDDFRKAYSIGVSEKVFLQFGDISSRKGILEILDSLKLFNGVQEGQNYVFVFAGVVDREVKETFYQTISEVKNRIRIIVFDEFCSFELLGSLCIACNYILIPYRSTYLSSGLLGYAAQFNRPLVAPHNGLIGKLVRKYQLGYTIKLLDPESLYLFFITHDEKRGYKVNKKYLNDNSVENFTELILR